MRLLSNTAALCGLALASLSMVPLSARAQERALPARPVRLVWEVAPAATGCPSLDFVQGRLRERLGYDPFDRQASRAIQVHLDRDQARYSAEISVEDEGRTPTDRRRLTSNAPSCGQIADAILLVLVLQLASESEAGHAPPCADTGAGAGTGLGTGTGRNCLPGLPDSTTPSRDSGVRDSAAREPVAASPSAVAHAPSASTVPKTPPPGPTVDPLPTGGASARAWLGLGATASVGQLPSLAPGGMVSAGVPIGRSWELLAVAAYLATRRAENQGARFSFSATDAFLGPSLNTRPDQRWRLGIHAGPVLGIMHAVPESPQPLDPGDSPYAGMRVGASAMVHVHGHVGVRFAVAGQALVKGWRFYVRGKSDPVWDEPPFGGRAECSLVWEE